MSESTKPKPVQAGDYGKDIPTAAPEKGADDKTEAKSEGRKTLALWGRHE
jgi:hypothetical protein